MEEQYEQHGVTVAVGAVPLHSDSACLGDVKKTKSSQDGRTTFVPPFYGRRRRKDPTRGHARHRMGSTPRYGRRRSFRRGIMAPSDAAGSARACMAASGESSIVGIVYS
jgi:hypothetical protein